MPILLRELDRNGRTVKQCDAKCYNGTGTKCDCCCYGKNHGVGLAEARHTARSQEIQATQPWLPWDHPEQTFIVPDGQVFSLRQKDLFDAQL